MKSKHGDAERKHVCDLCGKSFFKTYHLNRFHHGPESIVTESVEDDILFLARFNKLKANVNLKSSF